MSEFPKGTLQYRCWTIRKSQNDSEWSRILRSHLPTVKPERQSPVRARRHALFQRTGVVSSSPKAASVHGRLTL